jgi:hypothetical protein
MLFICKFQRGYLVVPVRRHETGDIRGASQDHFSTLIVATDVLVEGSLHVTADPDGGDSVVPEKFPGKIISQPYRWKILQNEFIIKPSQTAKSQE